MANGAQQAIENATRLSEIGFPEFTAKLITDTFNAITASYIDQMAQYVGVVQAVSQTLEDYINNTKDDITADEINRFLVSIAGLSDDVLNFLLGDPTSASQVQPSEAEAAAINNAVKLPPAAGSAAVAPPASASTNLTASKRGTIAQAIARRLAANKYDLLQTMVRQGILRLYVDNGTIETRLTFSTYGQAISSSATTKRTRAEGSSGFGAAGGIAGLVGHSLAGFGAGGGFANSTLTVTTANHTNRDISGSRVQIFGRVKLNFKTDLLPLAAAPP
jgi:hypothetical protein